MRNTRGRYKYLTNWVKKRDLNRRFKLGTNYKNFEPVASSRHLTAGTTAQAANIPLCIAVSKDKRVGVSFGATAFKFKRLATGYEYGDIYTGTVVPTSDVTRLTFFLGMT